MNATIGWALAVIGTAIGYAVYGWQGVAMAVSVMVFWLLLQFSRTLRVMRMAGQAPVGHVASAVMLHTKIAKGQRLVDLIMLTRSLGQKLADEPETYCWRDAGGASVTVQLQRGRVAVWHLTRPQEAAAPPAPPAASAGAPAS